MFQYIHRTHPRARHIKIRVQPPDQVIVVTPRWIKPADITRFLSQQEAWVQMQLEKVSKYTFGETTDTVTVFGKIYQKCISYQANRPSGVNIESNQLFINPLVDPNLTSASKLDSSIRTQLHSFLKRTASQYIIPRTQALSEQMSLTYRQLTLRAQKTRWGSCSSQKNVNFNWRLVHCPTEIIDYVIIHELAHLKHMNHSTQFWQLVTQHNPAHREHRGWLKRQGLGLI